MKCKKIKYRTAPLSVRYAVSGSKYKDKKYSSTQWQITLAEEVRQVFGITPENADTTRIVFVIHGDGIVTVECLYNQPPRRKWSRK